MPEAQHFLDNLERELAVGLPKHLVPERLAELSDHLNEMVEAYREMGLDEAAAVRAMGPPRLIPQQTMRVSSDAWDRRRLASAAFALAGYGANLVGIAQLGSSFVTQFVATLSVAATFGVAFASFRARRSNLPTLFLMGIALLAPMIAAQTALWVSIPYPEGRGNAPRRLATYRWHRILRMSRGSERDQAKREFKSALEEPWTIQAAHQVPGIIQGSALLVAVVGGVDLGFGFLGLATLAARRRRVIG